MDSDLEFILELRVRVARYLTAVDAWESAYRKFSVRRGYQAGLTPELDKAQSEYRAAKRSLEAVVPRARRLGLRYGTRDPWTGLLKVAMGETTLGRNERTAIIAHLDRLLAACKDDVSAEQPLERPSSWLQRVKDYFL